MVGAASTVLSAWLAGVLSASSPLAQESGPCREAHHEIGATRIHFSCVRDDERRPTRQSPEPHGPAAPALLGAVAVHFAHDVLIAGNRLPAGHYAIRVHPHGGDFVLAEFDGRASERGPAEPSLLQLATKTVEAPPVEAPRFGLDAVDEKTAALHFRYGSRKAALRLETTGHVRRSTPPPALPAEAREPWRVVRAALDAFLAEDVAAHVADFADDFETNFDDNAGLEAHTRQMHNLREEGRLEDMAVHLAEMEWAVDGDDATFGTIAVFTNFGRLTLAFSLERRDGRWLITYLDTRRTRRR